MNYKIVGSTAAAISFKLLLLAACFYVSIDAQGRAINVAILVLGLAVGWFIGILATPYGTKEESRFSSYRQAISAFLGGYLISKIDGTLVQALSWETLQDPEAGFRAVSFAAAVIASLLLTFVYRTYA